MAAPPSPSRVAHSPTYASRVDLEPDNPTEFTFGTTAPLQLPDFSKQPPGTCLRLAGNVVEPALNASLPNASASNATASSFDQALICTASQQRTSFAQVHASKVVPPLMPPAAMPHVPSASMHQPSFTQKPIIVAHMPAPGPSSPDVQFVPGPQMLWPWPPLGSLQSAEGKHFPMQWPACPVGNTRASDEGLRCDQTAYGGENSYGPYFPGTAENSSLAQSFSAAHDPVCARRFIVASCIAVLVVVSITFVTLASQM